MTDYVQIRKGGAWHRQDKQWPWTRCRMWKPRWFYALNPEWWCYLPWRGMSTEPQQPLCKRCQRIAEKEKR